MNDETKIYNELPINCFYSMLNTAFGDSLPITKDLRNVGNGIYSYTVNVPDEAKASVIGNLMYSSYTKGKIVMKSLLCNDCNEGEAGGFCINIEEKIF